MRIHVVLPEQPLPEAYFETRYIVLRKPLGAARGSERIANDSAAIHAWIEQDEKVVSVGRAALIPEGEDGSVVDVGANSSCPAFAPLSSNIQCIYREAETASNNTHERKMLARAVEQMLDDNGTEIPRDLRPAFQIRQMGTLEAYRGKGMASEVLKALEENCMKTWKVRTGWLQARIEAVKFYETNGWVCFGDEYHIENVGAHRNMWKKYRS